MKKLFFLFAFMGVFAFAANAQATKSCASSKTACAKSCAKDMAKAAADDASISSGRQPVVLLSPACASFDQFRSFEVRGNTFRQMVEEIQAGSCNREAG